MAATTGTTVLAANFTMVSGFVVLRKHVVAILRLLLADLNFHEGAGGFMFTFFFWYRFQGLGITTTRNMTIGWIEIGTAR